MRLLLQNIQVLNVRDLPPRDPYPASQLATLYQPETGDVHRLICVEETAAALRMAEAPVTVEVIARAVDTADRGRAFKLKVCGVVKPGGTSE